MKNLEEKFESIIRDDEKILWVGDVNKSAYVKSFSRIGFLWGLTPHLGILTLGMCFPYNFAILVLGALDIIPVILSFFHFTLSIIAYIIARRLLKKMANNTFFCITDKQIIKRTGMFANDYKRYPLSNIGTIEIDANIYDSKDSPESATLKITVKNFTTANSDGKLTINNLNNAHTAYKILSKHTDNEAVKVKQV